MLTNPQKTADLVTFTGEILNGKLHFLGSIRVLLKHDLRKIFMTHTHLIFRYFLIQNDHLHGGYKFSDESTRTVQNYSNTDKLLKS